MKQKRSPNFRSPNPAFMDRRDVAAELGFRSPATALKWAARYPDFPEPIRRCAGAHPRWPRAWFEAWFKKHFPGVLSLEENK